MNLDDEKHIFDFNFRHKRRNRNARNEQSIETRFVSCCNKILIWKNRLLSILNNRDFRMINKKNRNKNLNRFRKTFRWKRLISDFWCSMIRTRCWINMLMYLNYEKLVAEWIFWHSMTWWLKLVNKCFDVEWLDVFDAINVDINRLMLQCNWNCYRQIVIDYFTKIKTFIVCSNWMRLSSAWTRYFTKVATIIVYWIEHCFATKRYTIIRSCL